MARKLGSSNDAPDPINPNAEARREQQANVTNASFLEAVREIAKINGEARAVNERRKAIRKKWKAEGIELGILDATLKMAEWDRSEVRAHFDNARKYADWLGLPIGTQANLFEGVGEDEVQKREWRALGQVASRLGKPGKPPEECPPEYHQSWLGGFNDEDEAAWDEAEQQEAARNAAAAIDPNKPGNLADVAAALATPAPRKGRGVRDLKAATFDDSKASGATFGDLPKPADGEEQDAEEDADSAPVVH